MISINIDHATTLGQAIDSAASMLNQDSSDLASGLLFAILCRKLRKTAASPRPTPTAAAPTPAPVIPDRTETERRLGAID